MLDYDRSLEFSARNYYGIPELQPQEDFEVATTWEKWGRIARTTKVNPQVGYHFYTSDHQFTGLWQTPDKVPQSGVSQVIEVNYSSWLRQPKALSLSDLYKKRWLSCYWQSLGVKVWVDMNVEPELYGLNSLGIPQGWLHFATRYQAVLPDGRQMGLDAVEVDYQAACRTSGLPEVKFLIYGGSKSVANYCHDRGFLWVPDSNNYGG